MHFSNRSHVAKLLILCLTLPHCFGCDPSPNFLQDALEKFETAIKAFQDFRIGVQHEINSMKATAGSESQNWRREITDLQTALFRDLGSILNNELRDYTDLTIGMAGTELICTLDYLETKLLRHLTSIEEALKTKRDEIKRTGKFEGKVEDIIAAVIKGQGRLAPKVCLTVPTVVELDSGIAQGKSEELMIRPAHKEVIVFGYGLTLNPHNDPKLTAHIVDKENTDRVDLSKNLYANTDYLLVLKIGGLEPVTPSFDRIEIRWGSERLATIPFGTPLVKDPKRKTESAVIGAQTFIPPHTQGDRDFATKGGNPLQIHVKVQTKLENNQLLSRIYMFAQEHRRDNTKAEGWSEWKVGYHAPSGWKIIRATPIGESNLGFNIEDDPHGVHTHLYPTGDVVQKFDVWGDQKGDEAGTYTKVQVTFNSINVELEESR